MPPGTPYNGFILPYSIRVDEFTTLPPNATTGTPALHLLTHTHSDHILGLSAKSFGYQIVCSHDAKEMLLRHEVYAERALHEQGLRAEKTRTFAHLKVDLGLGPDGRPQAGSRDLLKPLELHTPTVFQLNDHEAVTITLFDANHCPGAVMFLVEGDKGAVLHTGDLRAEPWFIESLTHNVHLQPYLKSHFVHTPSDPGSSNVAKTLDAIYLDTSCLLSPLVLPTKQKATSGLVELIALFPSTTHFFINSWTWGYEDILKAIARTFNTKIHVDRYKYSIYTHLSDPFLRTIVTRDAASTRFHACERFDRCSYIAVHGSPSQPFAKAGHRVVCINPINMGTVIWDTYIRSVKEKLSDGEIVDHLFVPFSRHSHFQELQSFVSLFRPRRVVPNTLIPGLHGLDWLCMERMFEHCLAPSPSPQGRISTAIVDARSLRKDTVDILRQPDEGGRDTALQNLVGNCEASAERWAHNGRLRRKLDMMRGYLSGEERALVDIILTRSKRKERGSRSSSPDTDDVRRYEESDEETNDNSQADEERARTAHALFAKTPSREETPVSEDASEVGAGTLLVVCEKPHNLAGPVSSDESIQDARELKFVGGLLRPPPHECDDTPKQPLPGKTNRSSHSQPPCPFLDVQNYINDRPLGNTPTKTANEGEEYNEAYDNVNLSPSPLSNFHHHHHNWMADENSSNRKRKLHTLFDADGTPARDAGRGSSSMLGKDELDRLATSKTWEDRENTPKRKGVLLDRFAIAERLSRARPDLVVSTYAKKRAVHLLKKDTRAVVREQYLAGMRRLRLNRKGEDGHATDRDQQDAV